MRVYWKEKWVFVSSYRPGNVKKEEESNKSGNDLTKCLEKFTKNEKIAKVGNLPIEECSIVV